MQDMQTLMQLVAKHFGYQVGNTVRTEIEKLTQAENIDVKKLQDAIHTIQGLLDADPNTPEFDVGQNIVTQLTDHLNRIKKLESAVNTLNADASTDGSVDYKVKQAKDALQAEIDKIKGDSDTSISSLQSEVDAIEAGAGLDKDGKYVADTKANYISKATSIHNATQVLDGQLKELADKEEADKEALNTAIDTKSAEAEKNAKDYADQTFVTKTAIDEIDVCKLANLFAQAIDCGLEGKSQKDCTGKDCNAKTSGSGSANARFYNQPSLIIKKQRIKNGFIKKRCFSKT